jgi:thymidylate kinase
MLAGTIVTALGAWLALPSLCLACVGVARYWLRFSDPTSVQISLYKDLELATGRIIVISGLPASGKTSVVRRFAELGMAAVIPEHKEWLETRFPGHIKPRDVREKQEKQQILLTIDVERSQRALEYSQRGLDVVCDSDFVTTLAYNDAERRLFPLLDVFDWLVSRYCEGLENGELTLPDAYVFLDVPFETRLRRRQEDAQRKRNDMFFESPFGNLMRASYERFLATFQSEGLAEVYWRPFDREFEQEFGGLQQLVGTIYPHRRADSALRAARLLRSAVSGGLPGPGARAGGPGEFA